MPATDAMQFIEISDFTPGIYADWFSSNLEQPAPDGAAQLTGTYACVASPVGGLLPGPAITASKSDDAPTIAGVAFNAAHLPVDTALHMLSMRNLSGISRVGGTTSSSTPDDTFVLWQFYRTITPGVTNIFVVGAVQEYQSFVGGLQLNSNQISLSATDTGAGLPAALSTYGYGSIDLTRANVAAPSSPGSVEVAVVYYPSFFTGGTAAGSRYCYPKNSTPQTVSTEAITFASNFVGHVLAHQDRLIGFHAPNTTLSFSQFPDVAAGGGVHTFTASTEQLEYTAFNDYTHSGGTLQIVNENPSGYGSWVSMNANQLFLLKNVGGGVSVTGALENPTVTRLPGITSTLGYPNKGCMLPNGTYIYGTRYGVFQWSGGDTSTSISPQLDGRFWVPPFAASTEAYVFGDGATPPVSPVQGLMGTFSYAPPFVYAPNNFLFDTRTNSWWKLGTPTSLIYAHYDVGGGGLMIAGVEQMTASSQHVLDWYDNTTGQPTYRWTSQPLQRSRGRLLDIRECNIMAIGSGTVTFTLIGLNGVATTPVVFPVTSTTVPQLRNFPINAKASDVVVQIDSTSGTTAAAPRVLKFSLGYLEAQTAR